MFQHTYFYFNQKGSHLSQIWVSQITIRATIQLSGADPVLIQLHNYTL